MSKLDQLRALREAKWNGLNAARQAVVTKTIPVTIDEDAACLYRHFSSDGALLYVGMSISPISRSVDHRTGSPWFRQIARIELQWCESFGEAVDAERRAIQTENPRFNNVRYAGRQGKGYVPTGRPLGRPRKANKLTPAEKQRAYRERKRHGRG